jgi:GNAT superfamily N-acetyltransferase
LIWEAIARFWAGTLWGAPVPSEEEYQEFLHQSDLDYTLWQVAWDQDQPVGMVLGRVSNGCGYIDEVSVDSTYRRQGIAEALILYALAALRERGVQRVRLHTDANNRHCDGVKLLGEIFIQMPQVRVDAIGWSEGETRHHENETGSGGQVCVQRTAHAPVHVAVSVQRHW